MEYDYGIIITEYYYGIPLKENAPKLSKNIPNVQVEVDLIFFVY